MTKTNLRLPSFFRRRDEKANRDPTQLIELPAPKRLEPASRVTMLRDVAGKFEDPRYRWSLGAGRSYFLPPEKADDFIIKGYAEGELSRTYTQDEIDSIRATVQTVTLPRTVMEDTSHG